jgi:hypothetical protein
LLDAQALLVACDSTRGLPWKWFDADNTHDPVEAELWFRHMVPESLESDSSYAEIFL